MPVRVANPIYDSVFKHLMDDPEIASGLIARLIGRPVHDLHPLPQEVQRAQGVEVQGTLVQTYRLDFAAEIELEDGSRKKVLIEMQKAHEPDAVARFRSYLARHYEVRPRKAPEPRDEILPIIAIYFLGFRLSKKLPAVIRVRRVYEDAETGKIIPDVESDFLEALTHDAVAVQIPDIGDATATELNRALVLFNQQHRVGGDAHFLEITDDLLRATDVLLQGMTRRLLVAASDVTTIRQMTVEDEVTDLYSRVVEAEQNVERERIAKEQAQEAERIAKEQALAARDEAATQIAALKDRLRKLGIDPLP